MSEVATSVEEIEAEIEQYAEFTEDGEEELDTLKLTGAKDLLDANSGEFDQYQWLQIVNDRSNKEIAISLAKQGSTRYDGSTNAIDQAINQKYLYEKGILYQYEREAIIARIESQFDIKKDRTQVGIFPAYSNMCDKK